MTYQSAFFQDGPYRICIISYLPFPHYCTYTFVHVFLTVVREAFKSLYILHCCGVLVLSNRA